MAREAGALPSPDRTVGQVAPAGEGQAGGEGRPMLPGRHPGAGELGPLTSVNDPCCAAS